MHSIQRIRFGWAWAQDSAPGHRSLMGHFRQLTIERKRNLKKNHFFIAAQLRYLLETSYHKQESWMLMWITKVRLRQLPIALITLWSYFKTKYRNKLWRSRDWMGLLSNCFKSTKMFINIPKNHDLRFGGLLFCHESRLCNDEPSSVGIRLPHFHIIHPINGDR